MGLTVFSRRFSSKATARWRGALLAGAAALALSACTGDDGPSPMSKSMRSLSPETVALINEKGMTTTSPLVVRIFKEESELEVWKETTSGEFELLKTYPICRWSGELGPKVKEGDRQAPEGFYSITPGQMNANSQYHLAFDLGFPNGYDRAWGRSGSNLMVHGDCSSRGCYAMTDEQVQEIFALGRESFKGGQRTFQVQAYPFRMTADNMVRHRNNPNMPFWRMLKEGSDTFELTKAQPKVNFCGKRYVFNATPVDPNAKFDASAACPEYTQPADLQQGLAARRSEVNQRMASAGVSAPTAPVKTGKDGGMHEVFIAKLANPEAKAPGSLPAIVKPPGSDYGVETNAPAPEESIALAKADTVIGLPKPGDTEVAIANVPLPTSRPAEAPGGTRTQIAAAQAASGSSGGSQTTLFGGRAAGTTVEVASADAGFFGSVTRLFTREEPAPAPAAAPASTTAPAPTAAAAPAATASTGPTAGPGGSVLAPNSVSMAPPASSAFSLSNIGSSIGSWFGGGSAPSAQPAPQASLTPAEAIADVPMPPARPAVPPQASRPAAPSVAAAPRPAAAPASHEGTVAHQPAAAPAPAPAPQASTAPAYSPVPMPAAAAASAGPAPELRPSVTSTTSIYAQPSNSQALPGASIMSTGGFSSTVQ